MKRVSYYKDIYSSPRNQSKGGNKMRGRNITILCLFLLGGQAMAKGRWFPFKLKELKNHITPSMSNSNWTRMGEIPEAQCVNKLLQAKDGIIYAAVSCGEDMAWTGRVFKSPDGCETWDSTATIPGNVSEVYSILQTQNGTLYITTEDSGRIFKSINGGDSWVETGKLEEVDFTHPIIETSTGILYTGTGRYEGIGRIFKSQNKGETWMLAGKFDSVWGVSSLLETSDGALYAGTEIGYEELIGRPIFKSTDGGDTWEYAGNMEGAIWVSSIVESQDGIIYALAGCLEVVDSETLGIGKVFKSGDNGETWEETQELPKGEMCWVFALIQASDGTLYVGMGILESEVELYPKVFKSIDGGENWINTGPLGVWGHTFSLLETSDGTIYAGTGGQEGGYVFKYTPTGIEEKTFATLSKTLQVSPNPFSQGTRFKYQGITGEVNITIYDATGRPVRTLLRAKGRGQGVRSITWNGEDDKGKLLPSGIYFCEFRAGTQKVVKKMVLLR